MKKYIWAFLLLAFFSCEKESSLGIITIQFDHTVKGEPVEIEQIQYLSEAGHTFSVVNLRYYISEIVLHQNDGSTFSSEKVHLRDIHNPATAQYEIPDIPVGEYTAISFVFGLNEEKNVDGGLENTVENINMEWPIPGDQGYHYMKFEGRYDSLVTGTIKSFNVHTGATMGNPNHFEVTLTFPELAVYSNSRMINISMDLNEWFQNPNTLDFVGNELMMMNQAAQQVLKENGATVFSITSVN